MDVSNLLDEIETALKTAEGDAPPAAPVTKTMKLDEFLAYAKDQLAAAKDEADELAKARLTALLDTIKKSMMGWDDGAGQAIPLFGGDQAVQNQTAAKERSESDGSLQALQGIKTGSMGWATMKAALATIEGVLEKALAPAPAADPKAEPKAEEPKTEAAPVAKSSVGWTTDLATPAFLDEKGIEADLDFGPDSAPTA